MTCNAELFPNYFSVDVSVLPVAFRQIRKTNSFARNCQFFESCWRNTTSSRGTFAKYQLRRNFSLYFTSYLSIPPSKTLPLSKTVKIAKKFSVFGENESHRISNFYKLIFFETLIIFLECTIKLITRIFAFQK